MSTGFVTLSRQSGLMQEMRSIANNIANQSTVGFRREGVVFSEFIRSAPYGERSVSMASARGRNIDLTQGALEQTAGTFDVAIQGDGFFQVLTPDGERLTRAGSFLPGENGDLVTPDGHLVLDEGGAPIFIPPDAASVSIATDGTISADERPVSQLGLVTPVDHTGLEREGASLFSVEGGVDPVENPVIMQGFLEGANTNPVAEITRMIQVQRAYELGQSFTERESKRMSNVIDTLTR